MPSVMGLLEEHERLARQRVETLQAELREAETVWERYVVARETVGLVLAEHGGDEVAPVVVAGERPARTAAAVLGSVVPVWRDGLDVGVLAPDYRRLMDVLAVALGLEVVPAKVEGLWSKAKRLVTRGWLTEARPGAFSMAAGRVGGS
ncbi:hypothetical protein ACFWFU_03100 [Streptomyces sp. NPDC060235]|uniref:hypothetical protein n=1 Tax=Streptomyces sp. NPDC060235 TaxID=3347080 RepID=UPI0036581895